MKPKSDGPWRATGAFKRFGAVCAAAMAVACPIASQSPATAGAFTYGASYRVFNVAKLLIATATQQSPGGDRPAAFTFYILNNRPDVKPSGWVLTNPLAPKVVTTDILSRYPNLSLGQPITPNMAPYWQLDLTDGLSLASIRQYDMLVIHSHNFIDFDAPERSLLRQYVDQGGTLMFDDCGGGDLTAPNGAKYHGFSSGYGMIADVQWWNDHGSDGFGVIPNAGQRHPLITVPYFLSQDEINMLGDKNVANFFMTSGRGTQNLTTGVTPPTTPPDPTMFTTVVGNSAHGNLPYIAAGDYGSGHIIISAADIDDDVCNPVGTETTDSYGAYCGPNLANAHPEDLKFMVNALSYSANSSQTESVNPRHTASQASEFGGALLPIWRYNPQFDKNATPSHSAYPSFASGSVATTPAIYSNIAYVSDANGVLHAFDINPTEDLDADGYADDGTTASQTDALTGLAPKGDLSQGVQYDQLWTESMHAGTGTSGPVSSPTVAIVPTSGNGSPNTLVLTEDMDGNVKAVEASVNGPAGATGSWGTGSSGTFGGGTGYANTVPPAPTVYRGRIYAVQPDNTLLVIDPARPISGSDDAAKQFTIPLPASSGVVYAPTVAGISSSDGVYGGMDVVVTVTASDGACSLLLGSLDEKLLAVGSPGSYTYSTKSWSIGYPLDIVAAPDDRAGAVLTQWVYADDGYGGIAYNGMPNEEREAFPTTSPPPPRSFPVNNSTSTEVTTGILYTDYDLTVKAASGTPAVSARPSRYELNPTVIGSVNGHAIAGNSVVTPDNLTVYTANSAGTGYIAAITDQNPTPLNNSSMPWRFALVGTPANPLVDGDGISYAFGGYQFFGPPVVGPLGYVYALAYVADTVNPAAWDPIAMCFYIHPDIHANFNGVSETGQAVDVEQYDEFSYLGATFPTSQASPGNRQTLQVNAQFNLDARNGYLQIRNFNGLVAPRAMEPNVGFPMPIGVTVGPAGQNNGSIQGGVFGLYALKSTNGYLPLLQWWARLPQVVANSLTPMRKIGDWLYVGGTPSGQTTGSTTSEIFALNGNPVAVGFGIDGGTRLTGGAALPPSNTNTAFLKSFTVGTDVDLSAAQSELTASGRYAVVQTKNGIEGFGYLTTVLADNNRLIEFDPSGNAVWSCDSTYQMQMQGGMPPSEDANGNTVASEVNSAVNTTSKVPINRPSTLAQITPDDYLVADTGNNRCVRFDKTGRVIWELASFSDPNKLLGAGQPTSLNQPTSCITWVTAYSAANPIETTDDFGHPGQFTRYHYLIADPGNYRVMEVDDVYYQTANTAGTLQLDEYHILVWVSHTFDQQGRQYRYVSAQRYQAPDGLVYIMAAISNKRVAPVVNTPSGQILLQSPSQDSDGSSIVALYTSGTYQYAVAGDDPAGGGTIAYRYLSGGSQYPFPLITMKTFDSRTSGTSTTVRLRSLRFLVDYFRYGASNATQRTLICDDDGVFDAFPALVEMNTGNIVSPGVTGTPPSSPMLYSWTLNTSAASSDVNRFSFMQSDFDKITASYATSAGIRPYSNTLFTPSSALLLGNGDYLIANKASSGDPNSGDHLNSGGNAIEIYPTTPTSGTLVGPIYGIPANSGAVVQPSFALRPL